MTRRESRPNRKGAACVQCGVVPALRMVGRVCPDCAEVNQAVALADYAESHREQRRAYDRVYYAINRPTVLERQRAAWPTSAKRLARMAA